ncbi:TIGR03564 family F420-dependent LLM class oxidoreductase [Nocardia sp. NPDC050406]|uniref:TIGR03564 family F420-dependent LLM class oxidoreductase n=1 Tax=Nocardia sp. NPDC050406 TaxID=3364318 RepID=UPI0037A1DF8E
MPHGVVIAPSPAAVNVVDDVIAQARQAYALGVRQIWLAQMFAFDAIALAGLVGAAVPGLTVGTSAVPINPRHPLIVAGQAQTAQAASHGNFRLGLALGAHALERSAFGISSANTVQRLREHLTVLRSIFEDGTVDFHGQEITASPELPVSLPGSTPIPIHVAAMGPRALQVTGELADGTLPFLAGPRTIEEFIAPTLATAAAEAGRPTPHIIAFVPVLVTDDEATGRATAATHLSFYDNTPSYQKVIAREGASQAADLAAVGTPATITKHLSRYRDAGATEIVLSPIHHEDPAALRELWSVAADSR